MQRASPSAAARAFPPEERSVRWYMRLRGEPEREGREFHPESCERGRP